MADTTAPTLKSLGMPKTIDLTGGSKSFTFTAGGTDNGGSGVDHFTFYFDHTFISNGVSTGSLTFSDSVDSFSDGLSSLSEMFDASTASGTYSIYAYMLVDKAGNQSYLSAQSLQAAGLPTSFTVISNAGTDNTPPKLTSLSIPSVINLAGGGATATATAGATDVGTGVDHVTLLATARHLPTVGFAFSFTDSADSFSDGLSTSTKTVPDTQPLDTYDINSVVVTDKAGNSSNYSAAQLSAMGIATSFDVVNKAVSATVSAPNVVTEGVDSSFTLRVNLSNVTNATGGVAMTLLNQGGATDKDVTVSSGYTPFTTSGQNHDFSFALSPITILDDLIAEPSKLISIQLKATGFVFADTGTDTTIVTVPLIDNDGPVTNDPQVLVGTDGADSLVGGNGDDRLLGMGGDDHLYGGPGNDFLDGGAGNDVMYGGTGDDTYVVDTAGDTVVELPGEGKDTVLSAITFILPDNIENLTLTGSANLSGIGNSADNVITGNGGNNLLTGGGGNDILIANGGRDVISGDQGFDTLVLQGTRASYSVFSIGTNTFLIGAHEGVLVNNIEQVQFADQTASWGSVMATALPFDIAAYFKAYPDIAKAFSNDLGGAANHFVQSGFAEGRAAGGFSSLEYLASNPDLARAFGTNATLAMQHYQGSGLAEHRATASFDPYEYIASNPDLIKAFGANATAGEQHYITNGLAEGRPTTSFNALEYIASNPDLIAAFGDDTVAAEIHYDTNGYKEGRSTTSFDVLKYIASYPDLIKAFGEDVVSATKHYIDNGYAEGRTASFNALLYAASNTDLAKAFGTNQVAAEQHYIDHGFAEGRPTSGFDSVAYALTYQDLGKSGLTIDQDLIHWLTNGAKEGRAGDSLYGREQTNHALTVGTTVHDTVDTATDHDWFQAALTAGQSYTVTLAASALDPLVQIFDDHGVLLTQAQGATTGSTASLTFTASKSGTFYFGTSATDGHTGAYDLTVKLPSIPLQAREVAADAPATASAPLPSTDHVEVQAIGTAAVDHSDYEMMLHHHGG